MNVQDESRIYVESEDQPERMLLETKIGKDDGYQKQQGIIRGVAGNWIGLMWCRYADRVDRNEWDRHGFELPRS